MTGSVACDGEIDREVISEWDSLGLELLFSMRGFLTMDRELEAPIHRLPLLLQKLPSVVNIADWKTSLHTHLGKRICSPLNRPAGSCRLHIVSKNNPCT